MAYTTVEGGLQWANPRPQGECGRTSSLGLRAAFLGWSSVPLRRQEDAQREKRVQKTRRCFAFLPLEAIPESAKGAFAASPPRGIPERDEGSRALIHGARLD